MGNAGVEIVEETPRHCGQVAKNAVQLSVSFCVLGAK
jgi:hypothetical protein